MSNSNEYVDCPYCAELIKANAIKCKHCFSDLISERQEEYIINETPTKSSVINRLPIKNPIFLGLSLLIIVLAIVLISNANGASPIEGVSRKIYNSGLAIIEDFNKESVRTKVSREIIDEPDKTVNEVRDVISFQQKIDELKNKAQTENEFEYISVVQDIFNIQKSLIMLEAYRLFTEEYGDSSDWAAVFASSIAEGVIKEMQEEKSSLFNRSFSLLKNATNIEDIKSIKWLIQSDGK